MERLRVLFVTHTVIMAGANSSMLRLMLELRDNYRVEPVVLMPDVHPSYAKRNLLKSCREHGIECYSYRYFWFKGRRKNWKFYVKCLSDLLWYPRVLWKMRGKRFDIIHSNSSVFSLGALISRVKHTSHLWHLREFGDLDFGLVSMPGRGYERWVYRHGDVFIAISNVIKNHFSAIIPPERIETVYNGVVPPDAALVAEHNNAVVQLCMVGLLVKAKNQEEALRAAYLLVSKYGVRNFHLSFIGYEVHPYVDELHSFVEAHGLSEYVTFMGERDNVGLLLKGMDIGLMLSGNEAFGRVTVEYMMHGLAVIASDTGANQEIIANGESGRIYTSGRAESLAAAIHELVTDREQLLRLARQGRRRALELFTSERNTKEIFQIYQSLTDGTISSN